MHLCLFEDDHVDHLLPLVYTRAVYDLRLGMRTVLDTSRDAFGHPPTLLHARRLTAAVTAQENDLLANRIPDGLDVLFVNGRYVAEDGPVLERLRRAARRGEPARVFVQDDAVVAAWVPGASNRFIERDAVTPATFEGVAEERIEGATLISRLWHLLDGLDAALRRDYAARVQYNVYERPGARVYDGAVLLDGEHVFVAPGAAVYPGALLNAEHGPIYIDEHAVVREHAVIRGPAYIGKKAEIKAGASIEACAIGYWSKVGGEVDGTVIHSLSNKAHAGYLGDSYLGRWCNLGADTNNSNLKNDYGEVTLYNAPAGDFVPTGRQFMGLVMGDHSKCGINTMFNTGTVVGVFCNLYGADFLPRHVPSFSWGGAAGLTVYRLDKALRVAEAVLHRRDRTLTPAERDNLAAVFEAVQAARGEAA